MTQMVKPRIEFGHGAGSLDLGFRRPGGKSWFKITLWTWANRCYWSRWKIKAHRWLQNGQPGYWMVEAGPVVVFYRLAA